MPQLPIADKTTLDDVNAKTGTNTDAAGTTTLFARLKQIYDYLTGNLSTTRAAKIDNLNATISSRATASSVWTNGTRTLTSMPSVIKSIQRGTFKGNMEAGSSVSIPISEVNTSKAFVNLPTSAARSSSTFHLGSLSARLRSSTLLYLKWSNTYDGDFTREISWEVIEFN